MDERGAGVFGHGVIIASDEDREEMACDWGFGECGVGVVRWLGREESGAGRER